MNPIKSALRKTAAVAEGASTIFLDPHAHTATMPLAFAGIAAVTAAALGTFLATETGRALLSELRRRNRPVTQTVRTPSLRGVPTPKEITADGLANPRTLAVRLRIGSRLADLAPTLDASNHYDTSSTGARRIAARGRGMKGWLSDNCITINYSTLMRYKRLAVRLRTLLTLDERLPLEWLLPGAAPSQMIPQDLLAPCASAKRKLVKLLREHRNFFRLCKHVDSALGITRLPALRRTPGAFSPHRRHSRQSSPKAHPLLAAAAYCIDLEESLLENTKRELARFLQTPNLSPKLNTLRCATLDWLRALR